MNLSVFSRFLVVKSRNLLNEFEHLINKYVCIYTNLINKYLCIYTNLINKYVYYVSIYTIGSIAES